MTREQMAARRKWRHAVQAILWLLRVVAFGTLVVIVPGIAGGIDLGADLERGCVTIVICAVSALVLILAAEAMERRLLR